jgi:hypothetical protein
LCSNLIGNSKPNKQSKRIGVSNLRPLNKLTKYHLLNARWSNESRQFTPYVSSLQGEITFILRVANDIGFGPGHFVI